MKKEMKFKRILLCALLLILPFISVNSRENIIIDKNSESAYSKSCVVATPDFYVDGRNVSATEISAMLKDVVKRSLADSIKAAIQKEAENYVKRLHPGCSSIVPIYIVEKGLENNIDICFMMGQTQLETCFGKTGIGRSRKSIFGVEKRTYGTYQSAIDSYVQILQTSYLVSGKTTDSLLKNYVNASGHRYAGSKSYEKSLSATYKEVLRNTNIHDLQRRYNELVK